MYVVRSWRYIFMKHSVQQSIHKDIWKETQSSPTVDKFSLDMFCSPSMLTCFSRKSAIRILSGHIGVLCLANMIHIFLTITCFEVSIKQNTWRYIFSFFIPMFKKNVFKTINNILTAYLPFIKERYFSDEETIHLDSQNQYFKLYVFNMQYHIFTDIIMTTNTTMS